MPVIRIKLEEDLIEEMDRIIKEGWYISRAEFIRDAIRHLICRVRKDEIKKCSNGPNITKNKGEDTDISEETEALIEKSIKKNRKLLEELAKY